VLLWAAAGLLDDAAATEIEAAPDQVLVSAVTVWELEIKRSLGRLKSPSSIVEIVDESGFERLAVTFAHASEAAQLPLHHRDPFDRMLVAQARVEGLTLATADGALVAYDVPVLGVASA
jgi:PIN domain nuclease of toxin-antitoxin system